MVARFVAGWRKIGKAASTKAPERVSPKHAAILVTRPEDQMTDEQQQLFDRITIQCPKPCVSTAGNCWTTPRRSSGGPKAPPSVGNRERRLKPISGPTTVEPHG
jgi:hypothetical protein